jgi:hypothetical protein
MTNNNRFIVQKIKVCPKGLHSLAFYILIFALSLTSYAISSTKDYVRNYKQNMQNEPKFRKSQMNVRRVNEPKTNPIKANIMPKRTQIQKGQNEYNILHNKRI